MILLRDIHGTYINAKLIESISVRCIDNGIAKVIAYTPSYDGDCCEYVLAEHLMVENALQSLEGVAELMAKSRNIIIDAMHLYSTDEDPYL